MEGRRGREFAVDGKKERERVYCEWKEGRGESLLRIEYRKGRGDCYG